MKRPRVTLGPDDPTEAELLAALDPDADDNGFQVADIRAAFARARKAAR